MRVKAIATFAFKIYICWTYRLHSPHERHSQQKVQEINLPLLPPLMSLNDICIKMAQRKKQYKVHCAHLSL